MLRLCGEFAACHMANSCDHRAHAVVGGGAGGSSSSGSAAPPAASGLPFPCLEHLVRTGVLPAHPCIVAVDQLACTLPCASWHRAHTLNTSIAQSRMPCDQP